MWSEVLCVFWSAQLCTSMVGSLRLWGTNAVDADLVEHVVVKPNAVELDPTKQDAIDSFQGRMRGRRHA